MLDALLGLLQQSPPSANAPLAKYESLLKDREPRQSLLSDDKVTPMPSMEPIDKMVYIPKAGGAEVTMASINKIMEALGDTNESIKPLMMHTAFKESKYGNDPNTFNFRRIEKGTVGHGGIFQITDKAVKAIVNSDKDRIKKDLATLSKIGINPKAAIDQGQLKEFLEVPINSAAMARLHYKQFNEPLPSKGQEKAYYVKRYAPQTKKK